MNLEEILNFRRSVRVYDPSLPIGTEKVKYCLELSTLAPNSSNMQLWEFVHVTNREMMQQISKACLDQPATATATQIVVFVTRQDLHKKRAKDILTFERDNIRRNSPEAKQAKRIKEQESYYSKLMPFLYLRFFRLVGLLRILITRSAGLFRPVPREVSETDINAVVHKSCALAAQTFMIAMANEGYDTCPLEGYDSKILKKILRLPYGADINMVITCGIRKGNLGIRGDRYRIPFAEVYKSIE